MYSRVPWYACIPASVFRVVVNRWRACPPLFWRDGLNFFKSSYKNELPRSPAQAGRGINPCPPYFWRTYPHSFTHIARRNSEGLKMGTGHELSFSRWWSLEIIASPLPSRAHQINLSSEGSSITKGCPGCTMITSNQGKTSWDKI